MKRQKNITSWLQRLAGLAAAVALGAIGGVLVDVSMPFGHAAPAPAQRSQKATAGETESVQPIDLNTADLEKLMTVKGIGKALGQRILDYRKEHGPFKNVDELLNIRGIGERSLVQFRERLTVGSKP